MIKGQDSIAFLLYGEYKEKLGYISKLGISFFESNEIISEIIKQYNLGTQDFINYKKEIENSIADEINKIDWNNFNFTFISKFDIDDISGIVAGYIFRIFRLVFKDYLYCSHIDDGDSEASILNKSKISVHTYRAHCTNILDSLKILFFKYYSGSIDATNVLSVSDDAFLLEEIKGMKKFNIFLIKYCISNLWINILQYRDFKFRRKRNNISLIFNNHIYCDPILVWNIFDDSFKDSEISNFIINLDLKNIKNDFINHWLGEEYYKILDKEFSTSYNFSYSTFHLTLKNLIVMMKIEMSHPPDYLKNVYKQKINYTSITWYQNLGFSDYFIKSFKDAGFSDENINELKRFINDNIIKFQDLKNWKIIENNKLNGAFLETDEINTVTILLEFLYLSYLKNDLMLNIFNPEQKQRMTFKLGKIFEKKYSEYTMKIFDNNGNIINNDRFSFIANNPNVKLKNILELNIQDELETDVFFYNKDTDTVYVIELKNIIRQDYTWQDLETILALEDNKGWKEKIKKRVVFLQKNIEKLSVYIPEVSKVTKIRGIIVVTKPVLATSHFWKDELENEYFLCLPSTVQYIQWISKVNDNHHTTY